MGNGTGSPYKYPNLTAGYICKWIKGAKDHYNLTIDYVGVSQLHKLSTRAFTVLWLLQIWNERHYDSNYIKVWNS